MNDEASVILGHYDSDALSRWRAELETEGFRVQGTSSGRDVLTRSESEDIEAVVMDTLLPKMNGLQVLKGIKDRDGVNSPVIVMVLDEGDTYTENRALICGADAIVKRDAGGRIPPGTLGAKLRTLMTERDLAAGAPPEAGQDDLRRLLDTASDNLRQENPILMHITDPLTGLFNADYLGLKVAEEFKRARRFALPLTMVSLQLKSQKAPEDGDRGWRHVLNEVAGLLLCESRDIDILARPQPDTFTLLLPHTPHEGAVSMVDRILQNLEERELTLADGEKVFAAAGMAAYRGEGVESGEELSEHAAASLESAWQDGGSCHKSWIASA